MKTFKHLASTAALAACLGAVPFASAATIAPAGAAFSAPGNITVRAPVTSQGPVSCSVTFNGRVSADGSTASITSVTVGGGGFCGAASATGLPWTLTPTSTTSGTVSGVRFSVAGSNCGPSTVTGSWSNASNTLSASNQPLAGNCTINSLSVQPNPAFTVSP